MKHYLTIKLLLTTALFLLVAREQIHAEQRELKTDASESIDAVLVLDISGSMLLSDPLRLRDEGARLFIQFLKSGDRLAIVEFSEEAKIVRPLSPVEPDQTDDVIRQISHLEVTGEYTDLYAALNRAHSMLAEEGRSDARQMIVLISDGKMDPAPSKGSASALSDKLSNDILPEMKARGLKVYTLAFSEEADQDLLAQISSSTDAIHWFTPSSDKVHQSFADLFLAVKKPQVVPLSSKGFSIDRDVQEATFYITREEGNEIHLVTPDNEELSANSEAAGMRWYRGQKFDVITIINPQSGNWQLSGMSQNEGFATILTNLKLVTDFPSPVDVDEPVLLQARLYEDKKPVELPEMTGAITFAFQVTPTDRIAEPVIREFLVDDGSKGDKFAGDGIFSYKITLDEPGEYRLRVLARAPTFERQQQIPFRVRAPLLSINIVNHEDHDDPHAESAADHKSEGDEHHENDEHSDKSKAAPDTIRGDERSRIEINLSEETDDLRNIQIKLIAINQKRQRFSIPVNKSPSSPYRYEVKANTLPEDGWYQLQATLIAEARGKKIIREMSKPATFYRTHSKAEKDEEIVVVQLVEEEKKPEDTFPWFGLALVTLVNAGAGVYALSKAKQSQGETLSAAPDLSLPPQLVKGIAKLEKKISLTELDLSDPIFSQNGDLDLSSTIAGVSSQIATESAPAQEALSETAEEEQSQQAQDANAEEQPAEEGVNKQETEQA